MPRLQTAFACEELGDVPERPAIQALLLVALPLWGVLAALQAYVGQVANAGFLVAVISMVAFAASIVFLVFGHARRVALCGMGVALALLVFVAQSSSYDALAREVELEPVGEFTVRLLADSTEGQFGDSAVGETKLQSGSIVRIRLNLPAGESLRCWNVVRVRGQLKVPSGGSATQLRQRGIVATLTAKAIERVEVSGVLAAVMGFRAQCSQAIESSAGPNAADGSALLSAVLLGERSALQASDLYGCVKTCGLAHIVAVSGSHLAILVGLLLYVLGRLHARKRTIVVASLLFMILYVLFTGMPISAIRAMVMASAMLLSHVAKRRGASQVALALCIIGMIALDPSVATQASFCLSTLATLGIVFLSRYVSAWLVVLLRGRLRSLADILALTCSANVFTLPVSTPLFAQLSLVSPLSNALVGPLFGVLCGGGLCAVCLAVALPWAGAPILAMMCWFAQLITWMVRLCARVPYACIPASGDVPILFAIVLVGVVALYVAWPRPTLRRARFSMALGVLMLAATAFLPAYFHGDEIIMLDIGQGDAFVLRSGTHAMLVDTGTHDTQVLAGLARHDIRSLDAVLITHPDDDHCGSLSAILQAMPVGTVCVASDLPGCASDNCVKLMHAAHSARITTLTVGDTLSIGHFTLRVLSPAAFADEGGNADSLVCAMACDANADGEVDARALFTGDAESEVLSKLEASGALPDVDILKVPHHGSRAGLNESLLQTLSPEIALISVGEGNRYGHPTPETLALLNACGAAVFRTDRNSDVVCDVTSRGIAVHANR